MPNTLALSPGPLARRPSTSIENSPLLIVAGSRYRMWLVTAFSWTPLPGTNVTSPTTWPTVSPWISGS